MKIKDEIKKVIIDVLKKNSFEPCETWMSENVVLETSFNKVSEEIVIGIENLMLPKKQHVIDYFKNATTIVCLNGYVVNTNGGHVMRFGDRYLLDMTSANKENVVIWTREKGYAKIID